MISNSPLVAGADFERATGWELKPEGACLGPVCVPLALEPGGDVDLGKASERLQMPLVHDADEGLWSLGPPAGPVLPSAEAPDFELPAWGGGSLRLSSLRGGKVLILAWAPW